MEDEYPKLNAAEKSSFWQKHINNWKKSGLSQSEYCRINKLNKDTFAWRKRSLEDNSQSCLTLIPEDTVNKLVHTTSGIELVINRKLSIAVGHDFDPELLTRLLKTLGAHDDSQLG